jgi:hypothetical protein
VYVRSARFQGCLVWPITATQRIEELGAANKLG